MKNAPGNCFNKLITEIPLHSVYMPAHRMLASLWEVCVCPLKQLGQWQALSCWHNLQLCWWRKAYLVSWCTHKHRADEHGLTKFLAADIISSRASADWKRGWKGEKWGERRVESFILCWRVRPACCFDCSFSAALVRGKLLSNLADLHGSLESDVTVVAV